MIQSKAAAVRAMIQEAVSKGSSSPRTAQFHFVQYARIIVSQHNKANPDAPLSVQYRNNYILVFRRGSEPTAQPMHWREVIGPLSIDDKREILEHLRELIEYFDEMQARTASPETFDDESYI